MASRLRVVGLVVVCFDLGGLGCSMVEYLFRESAGGLPCGEVTVQWIFISSTVQLVGTFEVARE